MYVICRKNEGYESVLVLGRPYVAQKERHGQLKVLDETHDWHSYPAEFFSQNSDERRGHADRPS